jgi:hypothetical protein
MATIIKYEHHSVSVSVQEELKGKHREHCLCFQGCKKFNPGTENNCPIAQENYEFCVKYNMTTPVWECPEFEQ